MALPTKSKTVRNPNEWYQINLPRIMQAKDLMGGTWAMRNARSTYLPSWPAEELDDHDDRLSQAVLFAAYRKAVKGLTGKVFNKPIQIFEAKNQALSDEWLLNVDREGRDFNTYMRDLFEKGLATGKSHSLAEMPSQSVDADGNPIQLTAADEKSADAPRPYLVNYGWTDVIGWRQGDDQELEQVRIVNTTEEEAGDFETVDVEKVRVLQPGEWGIYSKPKRNQSTWVLEENGFTSVPKVPLSTFYSNRTGFLRGIPYLEDVGYLNVAHWQSYSDQRVNLHIARVVAWFAAGFEKEELEVSAIGPGLLFAAADAAAKLGLVETTGKGLEMGWTDLEKLEMSMEILALEPLVKRGGTETATAKKIDTEEARSPLQAMAKDLERVANEQLRWMEEFAGEEEGTLGYARVNTDFGLNQHEIELLTIAKELSLAGKLSDETMLARLQAARGLDDDWTYDAEKERLLEQGPVEPIEIEPPAEAEEVPLTEEEPVE
jgi:hypothetical protein